MKGIMSLLPLRTRHLMMRAALLTLALLLSACGGGLSKDDSDEAFAVNAGRDRAAWALSFSLLLPANKTVDSFWKFFGRFPAVFRPV